MAPNVIEISDDDDNDDDCTAAKLPERVGNAATSISHSLLPQLASSDVFEDIDGPLKSRGGTTVATSVQARSESIVSPSQKRNRAAVESCELLSSEIGESPIVIKRPVTPEADLVLSQPTGYEKSSVSIGQSTSQVGSSRMVNCFKKRRSLVKVPEANTIVISSSPGAEDAVPKPVSSRLKGKARARPKDIEAIISSPIVPRGEDPERLLDASSDSDDLPDPCKITASTKMKYIRPAQVSGTLRKPRENNAIDKAAREAARTARSRAKENEMVQKRLEKEDRKTQKAIAAEIAKVNVLRTDKKRSAPEMIVDLPSCLDGVFKESIRGFLKGKPEDTPIEYTEWSTNEPLVKWRRKVQAQWNETAGHFVPVQMHIQAEAHILRFFKAAEFVDMITTLETDGLDVQVTQLKNRYDGCKPIYLIEGLLAWQRKNRNIKDRQFVDAVRSHGGTEASQTAKRRRKEAHYVDEELIEDALIRLQVVHKILVHQTNASIESAEWVHSFTQHISTIPYQ